MGGRIKARFQSVLKPVQISMDLPACVFRQSPNEIAAGNLIEFAMFASNRTQ